MRTSGVDPPADRVPQPVTVQNPQVLIYLNLKVINNSDNDNTNDNTNNSNNNYNTDNTNDNIDDNTND